MRAITAFKAGSFLNRFTTRSALPTLFAHNGHGQLPRGFSVLKNPWKNKGTSFSHEEKERYNLHGLLPAGDSKPLDLKVEIAIQQLRKKHTPIDKYNFLHTIQDSDETLFYAILNKYTKETMPLVYTPTVGQACVEWSHIYRQQPRGIYISLKDKGRVEQILANYPNKDIKVIVLTDGERILGLGDLGSNGMGIPVGKLALYTTCAGIHPEQCLPVLIDVGTNTESILNDPAYIGLRQKRDRSVAYDALIDEFFTAAQKTYGRNVLLQFEDFGNTNAFRLLEKYRDISTCFNDDIQGTASVVLAGLLASNQLTGRKKLIEQRFLFLGAGEAGTGIADLIASTIVKESGCSLEEAKQRSFFVDSKGMVNSERKNLEHHKLPYAHNLKELFNHGGKIPTSLSEAIDVVKPTAIIGVSAQGGTFTKEVIEKMTKLNDKPLIFALSNPTSKAECTATDAYTHSNGKCIFASGSPFDPVTLSNGQHFVPGQGNNAYIFPGVGLGAVAAKALTITDDDFISAATELAGLVPKDKLAEGCCYPDLSSIRFVSQKIAARVAEDIYKSGRSELKNLPKDFDWFEYCGKLMYYPSYQHH